MHMHTTIKICLMEIIIPVVLENFGLMKIKYLMLIFELQQKIMVECVRGEVNQHTDRLTEAAL